MVELNISKVLTPPMDKWDDIWISCDYATYFHSREWAEIWQLYTKGFMKPSPMLVCFSDGKEVILPFSMQLRKGLVKNYFSSPEGTFGGWISKEGLSERHIELLIDFMMENTKNIVWRFNPYNGYYGFEYLKNKGNYYRIDDDETHVLELTEGFEDIKKKWSKGHRASFNKAKKEGVSTMVAQKQDEWDEYFNVYEDTHRRWGESAQVFYEKELFNIMYGLNSPHIKLWLARFSNRIIAGALCFYAKQHVVYWHGAALKDFFYLRPVNLLMADIIKDSCEKGYRWFDFNPSGGIMGVKQFKSHFNTLVLPAPVITQKTNFIKFYILLKRILKI
ncbi:MAG TPA: GNAT family N-acetyltransferase [Syntrophorhabdaceae bacterium]|nr:GNAT family N-acetyltransferase [Syntrophorhabdaceae bacterium]